MEDLIALATQWGGLLGFAALIAAVINVLKTFGLVKDGTAGMWSTILNFLGLGFLMVAKYFVPTLDVNVANAKVAEFANVFVVVFAYACQLGFGKWVHDQLSKLNIPVIGKSFSK